MTEHYKSENMSSQRLRALEHTLFLALLFGVSLAFIWLVSDFFQPAFWAAVLAVLFHPVYLNIRLWVHGRAAVASLLTIAVILAIVILPLAVVGTAVAGEATAVYNRTVSGEIDVGSISSTLDRVLPRATTMMASLGVDLDEVHNSLSDTAVATSRYLASQVFDFGQNAVRVSVSFFIMLYLLFFFLREGNRLVNLGIQAVPLGTGRVEQLVTRFSEVTRATIKSTLIVGVIQGTLGGLLFWVVDIDAAVFWGVLMTLLSLLPAVGSGLVWGPAAIVLLASGEWFRGLALVAAGTLLIGLVDNVLRPMLVSRDTKMPDYLILLTTLGGLLTFGLSGFVIGPVIAALFLTAWEIFIKEYSEPLDNESVVKAVSIGRSGSREIIPERKKQVT